MSLHGRLIIKLKKPLGFMG